jgi:prevent-host-death family protein
MKQAGIRQLKNSLSTYIKQVKKGETIIVTERGKAVAVLKKETTNSLKQKLEAFQAKGLIRMGEGGTLQGLQTRLKKVKGSPLSKTVIEDRR